MRKPGAVSKEIQDWTKKLETLNADLGKAQARENKAEKSRSKIVLKAKTGHKPSQEKLEQFTEDWIRSTREKADYQTAIEQCQVKLKGLETELKESKLEAGKALLVAYGKTVEKEHAPVIDKLVAEVITTIQKIKEPGKELRESLMELGFPETNFDVEITQVIGAFIRASFYAHAKRYFESRPHKHEWNKPLTEMLNKGRFEFWADKGIRDRARGEVLDAPMLADFSNMRIVSDAELIQRGQLTQKMADEAAALRNEKVSA